MHWVDFTRTSIAWGLRRWASDETTMPKRSLPRARERSQALAAARLRVTRSGNAPSLWQQCARAVDIEVEQVLHELRYALGPE